MNEHPKRRKCKDNPYELYNKENLYIIKFTDSRKIRQSIEINSEIYEAFNSFELDDVSQLHKYERHIEHSEVYEETLYNRMSNKPMELESYIIQKFTFKDLHKYIKLLTDIQQRRIKMYYFEDMTLKMIAKKENCSIHSVFVAIERAKEKLKSFFILSVKKSF